MADELDHTVATLKRSDTKSIRLALRTYKGHAFIDIREMFPKEDDPSTLLPSKKGCTIPANRILWLIAALKDAQAEAIRRRLVDDPNRRAA